MVRKKCKNGKAARAEATQPKTAKWKARTVLTEAKQLPDRYRAVPGGLREGRHRM